MPFTVGESIRTERVNFCPTCGGKLDAVAIVGEEATVLPETGDWTVCLSCGTVLRFNKDLSLRLATKRECKRQPPEVTEAVEKVAILNKLPKIPPKWY